MRAKFIRPILALIFCAYLTLPLAAHAEIAVGQTAPVLTGKELDGSAFDLAAFKGKVVLVHFWATWCPPCQVEMPLLDDFYKKYHGQGVELIGISVDRPRARDEVVTFMQKLSFPAALISDLDTNGFGNPPILPITYVIDKTGKVAAALSTAQTPVSAQVLVDMVVPFINK